MQREVNFHENCFLNAWQRLTEAIEAKTRADAEWSRAHKEVRDSCEALGMKELQFSISGVVEEAPPQVKAK